MNRSTAKRLRSKFLQDDGGWGHPYDEYHCIVMSNDYTKNISDSIFSPGIAVQDAPAAQTIDRKTRHTLYSGNKHGFRNVVDKSTVEAPAR